MKKIEYIILRHAEANGDNLAETGISNSLAKGEILRKEVGEVGEKVVKIIVSDANRTHQTAKNITKGMGLKESELNEASNRKDEEYFTIEVSRIVGQFIESNLIIIIIGHLNNIYSVARSFGFKGEKDSNPDNLEGYHFLIEQEEELKRGDNIIGLKGIVKDIGATRSLGTRRLIEVKTEDNKDWIIVDPKLKEVVYVVLSGEKYIITDIGPEDKRDGIKGIHIRIGRPDGNSREYINLETLKN